MRKLLISLAIAGLLLSFGCSHCPSQDIHALVRTPFGTLPAHINKGTLDKENEGKTWAPCPEQKTKPKAIEGDDA